MSHPRFLEYLLVLAKWLLTNWVLTNSLITDCWQASDGVWEFIETDQAFAILLAKKGNAGGGDSTEQVISSPPSWVLPFSPRMTPPRHMSFFNCSPGVR